MSLKLRNVIRPACMRNFSKNLLDRCIIIDDENMNDNSRDKFVKAINERLWYSIQEVNSICTGRILPYVRACRAFKGDTSVRIIINDVDSTKTFESIIEREIKIDELSHLINFKTLGPQPLVMVRDELIQGNARMLIDKPDQIAAAEDIFLDIAMFNSFSFLRDLPFEEKKQFSKHKYAFFKSVNEDCYYRYIDSEGIPPAYYSFAFSAREDEDKINYEKYCSLWNKFITETYGDNTNIVPPPYMQLREHTDVGNIGKNFLGPNYWEKKDNGDYLFLRVNSRPTNTEEENKIINYFGLTTLNVGDEVVKPISEYFNPLVRRWIDELIISTYKIVVNK